MPKFYVTNRWSTEGVETVTAALGSDAMLGLIWWRLAPEGGVRTAGPGEWFASREDAVADAERRKEHAQSELNSQITALEVEWDRLQALTFDAPAEGGE